MDHALAQRTLSKDGSLHVTDEVWNTWISGAGAILALIGSVFLLTRALFNAQYWHLLGYGVYSLGLLNLFVMSALHHGVDGSPRLEQILRQLDYFAVFLMIAASFTPFTVIVLRNSGGWISLGVIWFLALMGIGLKAVFPHLPRKWMTSFYLLMGWLGVWMMYQVYGVTGFPGIIGLMIGGGFYTGGAAIYLLERPNPFPGRFGFHEIWHLSFLLGAAFHFHSVAYLLNF